MDTPSHSISRITISAEFIKHCASRQRWKLAWPITLGLSRNWFPCSRSRKQRSADPTKTGLHKFQTDPLPNRENPTVRYSERFAKSVTRLPYRLNVETQSSIPIGLIGDRNSEVVLAVQEVLQVQQSHIRSLAGECVPRSSQEILSHLSSFSFLFRGVQRGYFSFRKCTAVLSREFPWPKSTSACRSKIKVQAIMR